MVYYKQTSKNKNMANTNANSGWNRPKNVGDKELTKRKQKPLWLRGTLAGVCVVALGGFALWYCTSSPSPKRPAKSSSQEKIKTVKPATVVSKTADDRTEKMKKDMNF